MSNMRTIKASGLRKREVNRSPEFERPLTTVDVAIFTVREEALQVLLVQRHEDPTDPYPGFWAMPGGFIDTSRDNDLEACALRKLREKTGIGAPYLEQLGSWGNATRDPRGWSTTHVYFALVPSSELQLMPGGNATKSQWVVIKKSGVSNQLAFDHSLLLAAAVGRLRAKVEYTSLPAYLMPAEFTLTELQRTYEVLLDRPLEKKAFRTRFLGSDLLDVVPRMKGGSNRPAQLFRLKRKLTPYFFARPFGSASMPAY